MSSQDLIAFVRAQLDYEDLDHYDYDKQIGNQAVRDAARKIIDEFERVLNYALGSHLMSPMGVAHTEGHAMGLGHAAIALALIWRDHPDWREGW